MMHERGLGRLAAWAGDVAAFVLPQRCPGCGAAASPARLLCDGCRAAIPRVSFALCARCLARQLGFDGGHPSGLKSLKRFMITARLIEQGGFAQQAIESSAP